MDVINHYKMDEINNFLEINKLSLLGHKIENISNAPPKLKEQLLHSNQITLYMPVIKNLYCKQRFKYFLCKFLENTCIQQIKITFVEI